jgi:transcriptional regulator with XRE-family HTH domain
VSIRLNHEIASRTIREQGHTVTGVAEHLGMDRPNLSRALSGSRSFPPEKIRPLAELLGVPPYALLGPEDPKAAIVELARVFEMTPEDFAGSAA